ncbi:hypothetical protein E2C01_050308 [Portunus trituberculatus]|uniref:Uncharacterized protein n=1 Tax=Portunus trituberculatus TaxID=210409 RepID=A0A5B7G8M5_PORTR|nr:hypothetical protein [Portunus trituberculatus]
MGWKGVPAIQNLPLTSNHAAHSPPRHSSPPLLPHHTPRPGTLHTTTHTRTTITASQSRITTTHPAPSSKQRTPPTQRITVRGETRERTQRKRKR